MTDRNTLPLMRGLVATVIPTGEPLILASSSPRRAELLQAAGYSFRVFPAGSDAECGMCSRETAPELVARYAFRKAADVARRFPVETSETRGMVLAADTVASCAGQILGKPQSREHAELMLRLLSGRKHEVFTGICLWSIALQRCVVEVVAGELMMQTLSEEMLANYLDSLLWEGKAGAFGYQDGNDWIKVRAGDSETSVVGLPMERLQKMLEHFDEIAETLHSE